MIEKVTLYSKDNRGKIRQWSIRADEDHIYMSSGLYRGEEIEKSERIPFGLGGRNKKEQIEMRIKSRINKKLDSGYVYDIDDARDNVRTNALGYLKAMKCSRYDSVMKNIPYTHTYIQPKLDGHHCSIINDNGNLVAYSSNGKLITSIGHILEGMNIPVGTSLEGELYHHGTILQTIGSWVKKKQEDTEKLHYYVYDIVSDKCYSERYKMLKTLDLGASASVLDTSLVIGEFDIEPILASYLKSGYEGGVLRLIDFPYEAGARSKGTIKVKPMYFGKFTIDDEFLIVSIFGSKDGWAILNCETETGTPFKVSAPGTIEEKTEVLKNKEKHIGKHVRVTFSGWTKDKKPFHPVAEYFREKFEE